ncbi:MAG: hypothetical protein HRT68_14950 [Flavobacteriaceae bacterium]|nr:hypothetical protein [Flavobacteriaceae bacterium]
MEQSQFLNLLFNIIPATIVGLVAYYFFRSHTNNEEGRRRYLIQKEAQNTSLPLRFQSYERMALFLERINPAKLLLRVGPITDDKEAYANLLTASIGQEFDHNLAQQIYISDECWNVIKTAKNTTSQVIRAAAKNEEVEDANKLREFILKGLVDKPSPSDTALAFIKNEVQELFS